MIAGLFDPGGGPTTDVAGALGPTASERRMGALRVAWAEPARAHEADGVLAVLDGFLVGASPRLEELPGRDVAPDRRVAPRLRGAFTLVVWDETTQTGIVVCDHFSLRACLMHGLPEDAAAVSTHMPALRRLLPQRSRAGGRV